jgi:peptidoglycan/xylan/chitin deacetylase (PgdA/CDA1 family)
MKLAHNIGNHKHSNYHTREEILACTDEIGFDGIYLNVYENQDVLVNKSGIMFIMGNYLGKDNSFDLQYVPALERYCTLEQVQELCELYNFELGWHTWSHPDLTQISIAQLEQELKAPFDCKYFAYPYGAFNDTVVQAVKDAGYERAWSVHQGTWDASTKDWQYKINRNYVSWIK